MLWSSSIFREIVAVALGPRRMPSTPRIVDVSVVGSGRVGSGTRLMEPPSTLYPSTANCIGDADKILDYLEVVHVHI